MRTSAGTVAALRIARRDALRHKARSILVIVMIALPVLALTAADVMSRTMQLSAGEKATRELGRADAQLTVIGSKLTQFPTGSGYSSDGEIAPPGSAAFAETVRRMHALLPAGTQLIQHSDSCCTPAGTATRRLQGIELYGLDLRQPLATGIMRTTGGNPPATDGEVAVTDHLASRLHLSIGGQLTIGSRTFRVSGVVHDPESLRADIAVMLPGAVQSAMPAGTGDVSPTYLAATSRPITWRDVQKLNNVGVLVNSRYVDEHPPTGVAAADGITLASRARTLGIATVAVGLAVLEVVLLAGATFAVGARRQRYDLALVAAAGGDERQVRRIVLAGGLVLGIIGAFAGVVAGVAVGKAALPFAAHFADRDPGHFDLRLLEVAAIAAIGLITGLAAAALPARAAARDDVVAALTGRRGTVTTARRVPAVGLAMIVLGALAAAYAAHPPARFTLVLTGAVVAEIGFVVCAPAVVGAVGRIAGVLPLTLRLPVRDASRHRGRTGPAVAAVLAAVAGSVAVSAWITSQIALDRSTYQPRLRIGQTGLQVFPDQTHPRLAQATAERVLSRHLPVVGLTPMSTTDCFDARHCTGVTVEQHGACATQPGAGCAVNLGSAALAVGDGRVLDALLGRHDAAATEALDHGAAVVFSPALADRGRATLAIDQLADASGTAHTMTVAAHVTDVGRNGVAVNGIINATTATRLDISSQPWGYLVTTRRTPTQAEEDAALADLSRWSTGLIVERGYHNERWNYGLLALAGAAALVTLGATAIATALSGADSRPDLVTLAAVGAPPRLRRRFAAGQAATVAVLGTLLGALAGLIPAWAVIRAHGGMPFATPWQTIGIVVAGVPLLAAIATGALSRSRLPSERRAT